jgi:VanZ family protein
MGQALFLDDRTASLGDVVANTLGAAVGLAIVLMVDRRTSVAVVVADRAARSGDGKGVERDR